MKTLTGVVIKQSWAPGSKSEHDALILVDHKTQKRYRLRQDGGPAFHDPQLDPLEGCTIKAKGEVVHGNTLIMTSWDVVIGNPLNAGAGNSTPSKSKPSI